MSGMQSAVHIVSTVLDDFQIFIFLTRDADYPLFSGCFFFPRYFGPDPFSMFSYFIFLFLNFLSLFVSIFCETARTCGFSVIFAKVQCHPYLT